MNANKLIEMGELLEETNEMSKQVIQMAKQVIANQRKINEYLELEDIPIFDTQVSVSDESTSSCKVDEQFVSHFLAELGVPAHIKGYRYILSAIMFGMENFSMMDAITKELYPEIAKKHNTTSSRVERAIRHAIECAWDRGGNTEILNKMFGNSISAAKGKPTNGEFITMIVTKLKYR